jgi:hypothetical protein
MKAKTMIYETALPEYETVVFGTTGGQMGFHEKHGHARLRAG